jgi:hypothetical protein
MFSQILSQKTKNKDSNCLVENGLIHQKIIPNVNIYSSNIRIFVYIEQTITHMKGETDSHNSTRRLQYPISIMARICRQKVNKET